MEELLDASFKCGPCCIKESTLLVYEDPSGPQ
jgi:hypothetical protein